MSRRIRALFIVDGSLDRPILHSQGLPLLRRMARSKTTSFILSFEDDGKPSNAALELDLQQSGIVWKAVRVLTLRSRWQRIQFVLSGLLEAVRLSYREDIDLVHSRSYRPGVIGSLIKLITKRGFIFDMRGLFIDEQVALGRWKPNGLVYKIARVLERWCILNADIVVANTAGFRDMILNLPYYPRATAAEKIVIIPNCVDTARFVRTEAKRAAVRERLGWTGRTVILFAGEVRDLEAFRQTLAFYKDLKTADSNAFLALICYGDLSVLEKPLADAKLPHDNYCLQSFPPSEMPDILAAGDIAILFRKDDPYTRTIASPIKFAEYLACGLPVAITPGLGDSSAIVSNYGVGVVLDPADPTQRRTGAETILHMFQADPGLSQRCRETAQKELSLDLAEERYLDCYRRVVSSRK